MVDPKEITRLHPFAKTDELAGGLYTPGDGFIDPATVCASYVKGAVKYGAEVCYLICKIQFVLNFRVFWKFCVIGW